MGIELATLRNVASSRTMDGANAIVFVVDAFTGYYNPELVIAAVSLARKLGQRPFVRASIANGKALHVHGYLKAFEKLAINNATELSALADAGGTLVGLDPSMTLAFRSEYRQVTGAVPDVLLPQEWLRSLTPRIKQSLAASPASLRLLLHCTERTNLPSAKSDWQTIFNAVGVTLSVPSLGCCGMAGTFGHEAKNRELSERIYAMSWSSMLASHDGAESLATGFSCRSQVQKIDRRRLRHPMEFLNSLPVGNTANGNVE